MAPKEADAETQDKGKEVKKEEKEEEQQVEKFSPEEEAVSYHRLMFRLMIMAG